MNRLLRKLKLTHTQILLCSYSALVVLHIPLLTVASWLSSLLSLHVGIYFYATFLHSLSCLFLLSFHFTFTMNPLDYNFIHRWQWITPFTLDREISVRRFTNPYLHALQTHYLKQTPQSRFHLSLFLLFSATLSLSFFYISPLFATKTLCFLWYANLCSKFKNTVFHTPKQFLQPCALTRSSHSTALLNQVAPYTRASSTQAPSRQRQENKPFSPDEHHSQSRRP